MAEKMSVSVCGAMGRMGQCVIQSVLSRSDLRLAGVLERSDFYLLGRDLSQILAGVPTGLMLTADFIQAVTEADVYIDFTTPASSLLYLEQAVKLKLPAVIGTTGFSSEEQLRLKEVGRRIPLLWAPNMSIGVNVMYKVVSALTRMLGSDYDVEIVEAHHRLKKDAPSGTALKLLEVVAQAKGLSKEKSRVVGRSGQVGERRDDEIGVLAVRGGDIVGDHTIYFCGPGERLELTHRAHTRDTFAQGAVRAASWLAAAGRLPGLYTLDDILSE